jgi:hypothetical protein
METIVVTFQILITFETLFGGAEGGHPFTHTTTLRARDAAHVERQLRARAARMGGTLLNNWAVGSRLNNVSSVLPA